MPLSRICSILALICAALSPFLAASTGPFSLLVLAVILLAVAQLV